MANYYQPEIETMPYDQLRALQNERFMKQMHHVWENVPYYREKMEAKGERRRKRREEEGRKKRGGEEEREEGGRREKKKEGGKEEKSGR